MSSSVHFVSLGCPKNLVDSQVMLGRLKGAEYSVVSEPEGADVIIVNTCSFIQSAKEESIDTILEMARYKDRGTCRALVVSGCLPQRYSKELEKEFPEVDLFIGTGQYHRVTEFLETLENAKGLLPQRSYIDQPAFIHTEGDARVQTGPRYSAYLKLSEGCNRRCSFCIIPKLRGFVRSRSVSSLVEEARRLASEGVRELNLVAQDLTHYGIETRYKENLESLLPELCRIEGIEWIRLHYVYPDQFSSGLLDVIARERKIVKYLDMPIQHTNDRLLRLMNRRLTKRRLFEVISEIRTIIPEMVFRTSIIVGFPSETDEEYKELTGDLLGLNLDYVGVFPYSQEEGTRAAELPGQNPRELCEKRAEELSRILSEQSAKRLRELRGRSVRAIFEGPSDVSEHLLQARMEGQAYEIDGAILINDVRPGLTPRPGDFLEVEITDSHEHDLVGKVL